MADLDKLFAEMAQTDAEDTTCDYRIDEDLRVIAIPDRGVVLGVEGDRDVNRVRFRMNRMWRGNDLAQYDLRINYENAEGDKNYYTVVNKTTTGDTVVFDWIVAADAVAYKGDVWFIVVGLVTAGGVVKQAFHTTLGHAKCLEGMVVDTRTDIPEIRDFMATLKSEVTGYAQGYVDKAANSATQAKTSETSAAASAKAAKTSETNAAASASNASTKAAEAKTSETNAAASAKAAKEDASAAHTDAARAETARTAVEKGAAAAAEDARTAQQAAAEAKTSATEAGTSETNAAESAEKARQVVEGVEEKIESTLRDYTGGYYRTYDAVLKAQDWAELEAPVGRYWYVCSVPIEGCDSALVPMGTLTLDEAGETEKANIATVLQTVEGAVRFFAAVPPSVDIRVLITLFAKGTASMVQASDEEVDRMLDEIIPD